MKFDRDSEEENDDSDESDDFVQSQGLRGNGPVSNGGVQAIVSTVQY